METCSRSSVCGRLNRKERWFGLYVDKISKAGGEKGYIALKLFERKPMIDKIIKYAGKDGKIIEVGCGTAVISLYLASKGYTVFSLDNCGKMLELSRKLLKNFDKKPRYILADIFDADFPSKSFNVSFSDGVLEHFDDEHIIRALKIQMRIAKTVVFSVPSNFFNDTQKLYGNERFMDRRFWRGMISKAGGVIIDEFSFFNKRCSYKGWLFYLDKLTMGILPRRKPHIGFVLKGR